MDRATQNLSNITHYLDGELKHFAKGGMAKGGKAKKMSTGGCTKMARGGGIEVRGKTKGKMC